MSPTSVLLSFHGTVEDLADLPAFLTNIRRGRPAPAELVREVARRYEAIGGSPLLRHARAQAAALEARLGLPVRACGRLWHPYPGEVLAGLAALGATRVLSLPLAPQSVDVYHASVVEAARALGLGLDVACAPAWGLEPVFVDACVESVLDGLARARPELRETVVLLTAHSLPARLVAAGDAYEREFRALCEAVGRELDARGVAHRVAFQSQGMTGDEWLGPDLKTTFEALAREGAKQVVVAPIGFVAEHVETLYDLDVEAAAVAEGLGLAFARAPAMNDRPRFIDALEAVAKRALDGGRPRSPAA